MVLSTTIPTLIMVSHHCIHDISSMLYTPRCTAHPPMYHTDTIQSDDDLFLIMANGLHGARRFLGMIKCLSYQSENCWKSARSDKLVDVLWLLEAPGKLFRWFVGASMFAGMSSQTLGEKFGI